MNSSIFLMISGLFPYLFIPTKETILIIGLFLILFAIKRRLLRPLAIPGLVLMFLGRPEAMFLLVLACAIFLLARRKKIGITALIMFISVYIFIIRDLAYATSLFMQFQATQWGLSFDSIAGLPVAVNKSSTLEMIYLTRLLVLTSVVVKWPMDLLDYLLNMYLKIILY